MAEKVNLNKLKKDNLLLVAKELQNKLISTSNIAQKELPINDLMSQIKMMEGKMKVLESRLKYTEELSEETEKRHYITEKEINKLNQYSRRENLEIVRIPNSATQKDLEGRVIQIFDAIDVPVVSYNIAACHHLKKNKFQKSPNVIIRFTNRKFVLDILANKKKLSVPPIKESINMDTNVFIVDNLCPEYGSIFRSCRYLRKKGLLDNVWTFDGMIQDHGHKVCNTFLFLKKEKISTFLYRIIIDGCKFVALWHFYI